MFNLSITRIPTALTALCMSAGLSLSVAPAFAASVAVYKVTDADGHVTYQNFAPEKNGAGRIEKKTFDPEANAMNFARPRAVGSAPSGGSNVNNNDIAARLIDDLLRRSGNDGASVSVSRGPDFRLFGSELNTSGVGGGQVSGIVTPSGNFVGSDNVTLGNANAGGGTGTGGGQGTGPAIVNPSTGGTTFTGSNPTFTGNNPTFTGNSPTFTSNSATFSSNTGTLGPATPGVGAGTAGGATNSFNNSGNGGNTGTTGSSPAPQTGVAPGTNPFAGTTDAQRGGRPAAR